MTFAEKFKEERVKKELTQQQVADSLGITRKMITLYEKGTSLPRTREAYKKIADFFGVDVNYLLTEDEDFVVQASEKYGARGKKQAQDLVDGISGLFAGGTLSEQDKDAVMKALQDITGIPKPETSKNTRQRNTNCISMRIEGGLLDC